MINCTPNIQRIEGKKSRNETYNLESELGTHSQTFHVTSLKLESSQDSG